MAARLARIPPWGVVALGYVVLAVLVLLPVWLNPAGQLTGGGADPQQAAWFMAWTPKALLQGHNPLFSAAINPPQGVNLMWNASAPLLGLVMSPVTLTLGPVVAVNVVATLEFAGAALAAYALARRLGVARSAAIVAGLVYGFGPFMIAQELGHLKVSFQVLPPLLVLVLHGLLVRRDLSPRRAGLLLGALVAGQALVLEETVAFGAMMAVAGLLVAALVVRGHVRESAVLILRAAPWALLVTVVVAGPALTYQFLGPQRLAGSLTGNDFYSTDLVNLLVPTAATWISPLSHLAVHYPGNTAEQGSYVGLVLGAALLTTVVVLRRDRRVQWAVGTGLVALVLSMGPAPIVLGHTIPIWLPWRIVEKLPLMGDTLPSRLFIYCDLMAAVVLAVGLDRALAVERARLRRTGWLVVAGILITLVPAEPFVHQAVAIPAAFTTGALPSAPVALVVPIPDENGASAMVWQAASPMHMAIVGGYFINPQTGSRNGAGPNATSRFVADLRSGTRVVPTPHQAQSIAAELRSSGVTLVVVGPVARQSAVVSGLSTLTGGRPQSVGGVVEWTVDCAAVRWTPTQATDLCGGAAARPDQRR